MASVFDAEPRWSGVKRILTVPPHQYVSLKDLPPLEDAPLVGRRRGVRTKRGLTIMPLTPDGEAWGGDDIASISSIMVARHRESFASTRSPLVGVKSAGKAPGPLVVTPVTLPALLGSPVGEPSSSEDDEDDVSVAIDGEGRAGEASVGPTRSLIAMLQHRLRPYAHYVAAQKTEMANTITSYADVVARAGDPMDESRISRDVGRTFAAFGEHYEHPRC